MKVVIACDSFKGTFSSKQIAEGLTQAIKRYVPECVVVSVPVSDGGEGVIEVLSEALDGQIVKKTVTDPNFNQTEAEYLLCGDLAVVESAKAAGITMCVPLDTKKKTTYGVGELIVDAVSHGAKRVLLGLGGTGTTDGGCGMAAALGTEFFDKDGKSFVPVGETLNDIQAVKIDKKYAVTALCDVTNPLCGESGAAAIYGPQKGATPQDVVLLDNGLSHLSDVIRSYGYDYADIPGSGAAGGLGYGTLTFCLGKLSRGIDAVLDEVHFASAIEGADLIITGEGALDHQSFCGKVVDGVLSRSQGVPTVAFVGISKISDYKERGLSAVFETNEKHLPFAEIIDRLDEQFLSAADRLGRYVANLAAKR
ncbi:MAG: glycerate kinase [Clostridia bacterium]|nr:glycerate kinase [Clostridia bacterium]